MLFFEALFFRYTSKILGFIIAGVEKHKLGRDSLSDLCENVNEIEHWALKGYREIIYEEMPEESKLFQFI